MRFVRILLSLGWCMSQLAAMAPASSIEISQNTFELSFPRRIQFNVQASSTAPIDRVVLLFGTNGRSCQDSATRQEIDFDPEKEVSLEWEWDLRTARPLPPGAEIWWQWEIRDQSGNTLTSDKKSFVVEDDAFTWKSISRENITVYWVEGSRSFATKILDTALSSLKRLTDNAGVHPAGNIRLNIYPTIDDLKASLLYEPTWIGGIAFPEYGSLSTVIEPGEESWVAEVIPHELAHLVTGELTFNCYGAELPTWLEEGLAVYSENKRSLSDINLVKSALKKGTLEPLHDLTAGFSADPNEADLNYAQSGMVVAFMVETYGAEKMAALLASIGEGKQFSKALLEIYGMDTDGLDAAWRSSLGYSVATSATARPSEAVRPTHTPVPTLAIWTSVGQAVPSATATGTATSTLTPRAATATVLPASTATPVPTTVEATAVPGTTKSPGPCAAGLIAPMGMVLFAWKSRVRKATTKTEKGPIRLTFK